MAPGRIREQSAAAMTALEQRATRSDEFLAHRVVFEPGQHVVADAMGLDGHTSP